jgi:site-specific DNA-cytosine methylase
VVASIELSYGQDIADLRNERTTLAAVDLLTAGFSCKPFSCEGGRLGTRDPDEGDNFQELSASATLEI